MNAITVVVSEDKNEVNIALGQQRLQQMPSSLRAAMPIEIRRHAHHAQYLRTSCGACNRYRPRSVMNIRQHLYRLDNFSCL